MQWPSQCRPMQMKRIGPPTIAALKKCKEGKKESPRPAVLYATSIAAHESHRLSCGHFPSIGESVDGWPSASVAANSGRQGWAAGTSKLLYTCVQWTTRLVSAGASASCRCYCASDALSSQPGHFSITGVQVGPGVRDMCVADKGVGCANYEDACLHGISIPDAKMVL